LATPRPDCMACRSRVPTRLEPDLPHARFQNYRAIYAARRRFDCLGWAVPSWLELEALDPKKYGPYVSQRSKSNRRRALQFVHSRYVRRPKLNGRLICQWKHPRVSMRKISSKASRMRECRVLTNPAALTKFRFWLSQSVLSYAAVPASSGNSLTGMPINHLCYRFC
jgi:hypothetical protein